MSVDDLKSRGNKAFAAKSYDEAIDLFSQAINLDPSNHVLYSNRSAARAGKKQYDAALEDAEAVRPLSSTSSNCGLTYCLRTVYQRESNLGKRLRTQRRRPPWPPPL